MKNEKRLLEAIISEIEKEHPHLKKAGGLNDFNQLLNPCTTEKIVEYIKTARFFINPFVGDPLFKNVKLDFTSIYVDINFEYSLLNGVSYRIEPFIVETLDINISEYVFAAIEKLIPEKKPIIKNQWESWTIEQKIDLLYELERASLKKADEWLKENSATYFFDFEKETRNNILLLMNLKSSL